jgi:tetratricopeptide (TPR) repeat protein
MRFREIFIVTKGTKVILLITFSVSALAVIFAFFYYRSINRSEDPRIRSARELLLQYERVSGQISHVEVFHLLDSANAVFRSVPDYESSFEIGLVYNNKCSYLLLMSLYDSTLDEDENDKMLALSMKYCDSSIAVYRQWLAEWESLTPELITEKISPYMRKDDPAFIGLNFRKVFSRRVENIITAQVETPRRLSVSLTNKGTIYRHLLKPDSALVCYQQALVLWDKNRTAKSNLNVLMGLDPVKPTVIESLFPPEKNKK